MKATRIALTGLALLLLTGLALGQERKKLPADEADVYTVSAKIGVLNIVEGDVSYKRDQADWARLTAGDELRDGDAVKTGASGRAEVLLTPGCYLRLAENSSFVLDNPHVYQFRITLTSGSAIIEATVLDAPMTVATSKNEFSIIKEGLYRFNLTADGRAEAVVRKGRLTVGSMLIKGDQKVSLESGQPLVASFDKKRTDSFDLWSQDRARDLIALNKRLSQRDLVSNTGFGNAGLGFLSNVWIYSRRCGCYTFLPFGSGFASPYGWDYAVCNPFWNGYSYYPGYWWGGGYYSGGRSGSGSGTGSGSGGGTGGGGTGSGGGTGGGHRHKPGKGDNPGIGPIHPPVRADSAARDNGARYNPPSRSDSGHYRQAPSSSYGSSHHNSPASAPSMPAHSMPSAPSSSSSSSGGGGGHHKNN